MSTWQEKTAAYRAAALKKIPSPWLLSEKYCDKIAKQNPTITISVLSIPGECGILTAAELEITESYTAIQLANALAKGELKAVDVTTAFCKRAAIAQQLTNCLTETMFEFALNRAKELDDYYIKEGKVVGPLHGVPISLKDSFNVKGVASTIGYVSFIDHGLEENNSPLVDVLLKLGAVLYVKTNLPQTLMTADSDNNVFGRVLNPHNPSLTAGGSSGGEGALVALRGSLLGIGTDIGGSIRIPALCCGTYGFKPSTNRMPNGGQAASGKPGSPGFTSVNGPLTTSFDDMQFLVNTVIDAKPWDYDATALAVPWRSALPAKKTLKIGVLKEDPKWPCWPPVRRAVSSAVEKLKAAGHDVVFLKGEPSVDEGVRLAFENFGFDNTKQAAKNILASGEPFVESVQRVVARAPAKEGGWLLEEVYDVNVRRTDYFTRWNKIFVDNGLDCIIGPGAQTTAVVHDTFDTPPYTCVWNTLEYPGVIIPYLKADKNIDTSDLVTLDPERPYDPKQIHGAPIHVQVVARRYMDEELLQASKVIDECLKQ